MSDAFDVPTEAVTVANFPTTQNVDIVASITVPVSAASLPLPSNAAKETGGHLASIDTNVAKEFGTWGYYAGTNGTIVVSGGQRVIGIGCHSTLGGSFTINGGASVPVPAGVGISIEPKGNIIAPTIIFTTTDSYFIEVVS